MMGERYEEDVPGFDDVDPFLKLCPLNLFKFISFALLRKDVHALERKDDGDVVG